LRLQSQKWVSTLDSEMGFQFPIVATFVQSIFKTSKIQDYSIKQDTVLYFK